MAFGAAFSTCCLLLVCGIPYHNMPPIFFHVVADGLAEQSWTSQKPPPAQQSTGNTKEENHSTWGGSAV